jgi:hypothetical protein
MQAEHVSRFAELPPETAARMQAHLKTCEACRELQQKLLSLEIAWRDLPLVPSAEAVDASRDAFLHNLPLPVSKESRPTLRVHRLKVSRRVVAGWMAAAAVLLLTVGLGSWMMWSQFGGGQNGDALVERLLSWNVDLARTPAGPERERLAGLAGTYQAEVQRGRLSPEVRELAQDLLDIGTDLATHDNPKDKAEILIGMTSILKGWMDQQARTGHPDKAKKYRLEIEEVSDRIIKDLPEDERKQLEIQLRDQHKPGRRERAPDTHHH